MKEINGELIKERIDLYLEENWEAILVDIDKRVDKMIKSIIRETFSSGYNRRSNAQKLIYDKVDSITKDVLSSIEYDKKEMERLILKKVEQAARKVEVKFV